MAKIMDTKKQLKNPSLKYTSNLNYRKVSKLANPVSFCVVFAIFYNFLLTAITVYNIFITF